jgi:hypothetical protein
MVLDNVHIITLYSEQGNKNTNREKNKNQQNIILSVCEYLPLLSLFVGSSKYCLE